MYVHSLAVVVRRDAFADTCMAGTINGEAWQIHWTFYILASAGIVMLSDANSSISGTIDRYMYM